MPPPLIRVSPSPEHVAAKAALAVRDAARADVGDRGRCVVALAGGSSSRRLYQHIAVRMKLAFDWPKIVVTFGDERCVPPSDAASNYRMANESLLIHVPLQEKNILRVIGDDGDAGSAAEDYEHRLTDVLGDDGRIDLVLLGMGEDGHTASLFAGAPDPSGERLVIPATAPEPHPVAARVSLSYRAIAQARRVFVIVTGAKKATCVRQAIRAEGDLPLSRVVRERDGDATFFLDEAAALDGL